MPTETRTPSSPLRRAFTFVADAYRASDRFSEPGAAHVVSFLFGAVTVPAALATAAGAADLWQAMHLHPGLNRDYIESSAAGALLTAAGGGVLTGVFARGGLRTQPYWRPRTAVAGALTALAAIAFSVGPGHFREDAVSTLRPLHAAPAPQPAASSAPRGAALLPTKIPS